MTEHIRIERHDALQIIRFNRPEKKNAITRGMYRAMTTALLEGDADVSVRCHVFLGSAGCFSAGNDLKDFLAVAEGGENVTEPFDFLLALAGCHKPLLAGVDGIAVGIGATLNLHCDLTFATPQTVFRTPFVDLGLVPEAGSSRIVPRTIGAQRAFALLALGEGLAATEAQAAGLIYRVVSPSDLEEAVLAAARKLAAKPPEALKLTRDLLRAPHDEVIARIKEEAEHYSVRLKSEEARSAFAAFLKR